MYKIEKKPADLFFPNTDVYKDKMQAGFLVIDYGGCYSLSESGFRW